MLTAVPVTADRLRTTVKALQSLDESQDVFPHLAPGGRLLVKNLVKHKSGSVVREKLEIP
jgi:hypothetical protein